MLRFLGYAAALLALVVVVVLIVASTKPASYSVERTTVIAAPPEKVAALVEDFHQWKRWSPWMALDPQMTLGYAGAESGTGAVYTWKGNSKAGEGRMEMLSATPNRADIKLYFLKPFKSTNDIVFVIVPEGPATRVAWTMTGPMMFASKVMAVFVSMEKMMGPDFERGLLGLKSVAEGKSGQA